MLSTNGGVLLQHQIFSLNVDTGAINPGWPVDLNSITNTVNARFDSHTLKTSVARWPSLARTFTCPTAVILANATSTTAGSCKVPLTHPANASAWATPARSGGIWSVGGVASDGVNPYVATGNTVTHGTNLWGGGNAIIRFHPGPTFTNTSTRDFWATTNWLADDKLPNQDLGGCGPLLVTVPGATPSNLVVALGKDGIGYLLNRTNLGGISRPLSQTLLATAPIIQAAAAYQTHERHVCCLSRCARPLSRRRRPWCVFHYPLESALHPARLVWNH